MGCAPESLLTASVTAEVVTGVSHAYTFSETSYRRTA